MYLLSYFCMALGHRPPLTPLCMHSQDSAEQCCGLAQVDMLLLPSAPGAAPTVADASQWGNQQLLAVDALNMPATLAGPPSCYLPDVLFFLGYDDYMRVVSIRMPL